MAKAKLTGISGESLSSVPKIKSVKPTGNQILVEFLTAQEAMGTSLDLGESKVGAPQGYILDLGPKVSEEWGIKKGDRVLCSGNFVPCPEMAGDRMVGLLEPHAIKAVLVEE